MRARRGRAAGSAPSASSFLIARMAVGAVNSALTPCSDDDAPERARVRRPHRLALVEHGGRSRKAAARRRYRSGRPPSPRRTRPRTPRPGRCRRCVASSTSAPPRGRRCRARCPWACRWCRRCTACKAGRSPPPDRGRPAVPPPSARASRDRAGDQFARDAGRAGGSRSAAAVRAAASSARSSSGLYSTMRLGSIPHDAETTTFGPASSMRTASSCEANPPKTTECMAPMRAHASIAMRASGTIGI